MTRTRCGKSDKCLILWKNLPEAMESFERVRQETSQAGPAVGHKRLSWIQVLSARNCAVISPEIAASLVTGHLK